MVAVVVLLLLLVLVAVFFFGRGMAGGTCHSKSFEKKSKF